MKTLALVTLASLLMLGACGMGDPASQAPVPLVIRTYELPANIDHEIDAIVGALVAGTQPPGLSMMLPNGSLAVSAPAGAQADVAALIGLLSEHAKAPSPRIRLHYWLIRASAAEAVMVAQDLRPLTVALEDLSASAGPMQFEPVEYAQQVSRSGERVSFESNRVRVRATAAVRGQRVAVQLEFSEIDGPRLQTALDFETGETIVLAQMSAAGEPAQEMRVFVVKAELF